MKRMGRGASTTRRRIGVAVGVSVLVHVSLATWQIAVADFAPAKSVSLDVILLESRPQEIVEPGVPDQVREVAEPISKKREKHPRKKATGSLELDSADPEMKTTDADSTGTDGFDSVNLPKSHLILESPELKIIETPKLAPFLGSLGADSEQPKRKEVPAPLPTVEPSGAGFSFDTYRPFEFYKEMAKANQKIASREAAHEYAKHTDLGFGVVCNTEGHWFLCKLDGIDQCNAEHDDMCRFAQKEEMMILSKEFIILE